jgi:uncharacterized protein (TIGR03066 family)
MKNRIAALKKSIHRGKQHRHRSTPAGPGAAPGRMSWKRQVFLGLCLVLACGGTWAFAEFVVWNRIPSELVGKWVVTTPGEQEGATFDFYRGGQMVGRVNQGGRLAIVNAAIRVEGNTILSTTRHPQTGVELTVAQKIRTLSPSTLIVEDEKGNVLSMARAD